MGDHLSAKLTGADDLLSKILALKSEKYGIFRRVATKVARPLVSALRQAYQKQTGVGLKTPTKKVKTKVATAVTKYRGIVSGLAQKLANRAKPTQQKPNELLNPYLRFKKARKLKARVAKLGVLNAPKVIAPKAKKIKPRKYSLPEIGKMISTIKEKRLMGEIINDRRLLGGAANQKRGMVNTLGMTGGLAKSINFKISMAKAKAVALSRVDGSVIGGTGIKPGGGSADWGNRKHHGTKPEWKRISSERVVMLVGATKRPMVVWNPFVKRLVKVDPKRYLHLVETGHSKIIRGKKRGFVKGKKTMETLWTLRKTWINQQVKNALAQELGAVMAKKAARLAAKNAGGGP